MNNIISSFTLYEFLRILMPGCYFTLNLLQFVRCNFIDYTEMFKGTEFSQTEAAIIFIIVSVVLGILIYALDNPRVLKLIIKNLPTNIISKRHSGVNEILIMNSYFTFYESLPDAFKIRIEREIGFFHLSMDMIFVNLISIVLLIITTILGNHTSSDALYGVYKSQFVMVIFLLLISLLSAYLIYSKRLKYNYKRNAEMYFKSEFYQIFLTLIKS